MGRFRVRALAPLLVLGVAVLSGSCGDEITYEVLPEAGTGAVRIAVEPAALDAPWSLILPGGATASGSGEAYLPNMPAGSYTIAWGEMGDWDSPPLNPFTETLAAGAVLELRGEYIYAPPLGSIVIDPDPNGILAPWLLSGPGGFGLEGRGDRTLTDMPAGEYTLGWGGVGFHDSPEANPVTGQLGESEILTFTGAYALDESLDRFGIYADSLGTVRAVTILPNAITTLYFVAHLPSVVGHTLGAIEFSVPNWLDAGAAGVVQLEWMPGPIIGEILGGIAIALVPPIVPDAHGNILIGTARVLSLDAAWPAADTEIRLAGYGSNELPAFAIVGDQGDDPPSVSSDTLFVNPVDAGP